MNKKEFECLILDMSCTEEDILASSVGVSDEEIILKIEKISDLEAKDKDGRTLLINAACYGREKVLHYLLKKGVDVHAKDNDCFTALHAAVIANDIGCVKCLLEAGCDVNAKNIFGNNPIMLGDYATDLEIYKILMKYGANPEQKNNYGISAKDVFVCSEQIMKILTGVR